MLWQLLPLRCDAVVGAVIFLQKIRKNIKKVLDIGIYLCYYNIRTKENTKAGGKQNDDYRGSVQKDT